MLDTVCTNRDKSQNVPQGSKLQQHYYYYSIDKNHCTSINGMFFIFLMQQK